MSTTSFSLDLNSWSYSALFGSTSTNPLTYTRTDSDIVPADILFPGVQTNSPYLVKSNNESIHIIFGTYDSGTSAWTWLVPTIAERAYTFSITRSDAVVYPFVFIDRVAYCTFALTKFDGSGGANAVTVTTLCAGTYQLGIINWQPTMKETLLPTNGIPVLIDASKTEAIDVSLYKLFNVRINDPIDTLGVNIGQSFGTIVETSDNTSCNIYIFEPSESPPSVTLLATQHVTTYTITSDDTAAYTLNNYIVVNNNNSMTVTNASLTNTLTINDYATQPSGFQAPSKTGVTYTPQTQTHFIIRQNGWKQTTFDGSRFSYAGTTQVSAVSAFPNDSSVASSHWITSDTHPGFAIIFGTYDSSGSTWTWLTPTVMDDLFMFTVNASAADDTTVVYPFVVSRANDNESAKVSCVQYYNSIHAADGTHNEAYSFVGTAQLTTACKWDSGNVFSFLPTNDGYINIVLDATTTPVTIDITDYYNSVPDHYDFVISVMCFGQNDIQPNYGLPSDSDYGFSIYIIMNESSLQPITIENIPNNAIMYMFNHGGNYTVTINNHVSFGANSFVQVPNNMVFNDYAVQPIGFAPFVGPTVKYNHASVYARTAATPVQQIAHMQSVQRNLQTIFDRVNVGLVEHDSQNYIATGAFSDAVWEQFRSLASEVIGDGGGGGSSGFTEIKGYSVTVPNGAAAANVTVEINNVQYTLYVAHGGAYYAVQGSSAGITVAGLSNGLDWSTLTGGVVAFTLVESSTKLFFNGVMQPIVTDWTTTELGNVSGNIGNKTVAWVGDKAVPFITFKNVQPSFILVPSS